jgi:hypothetical protein
MTEHDLRTLNALVERYGHCLVVENLLDILRAQQPLPEEFPRHRFSRLLRAVDTVTLREPPWRTGRSLVTAALAGATVGLLALAAHALGW